MSDFPEVNKDNFEDEVIKSDTLVLVYFWAEWCGACKMANQVLKTIAEENSDILKVVAVNADSEKSLLEEYKINKMPTILFCINGNVEDEIYGALQKLYIQDIIRRICNKKELR